MPSIEVSDKTFASLQAIAKPFIDSPDDVIRALLQSAGGGNSNTADPSPIGIEIMDFPSGSMPSLKFAVVRSYVVDGTTYNSAVYWSTLIAEMLRACAKRGLTPQALAQAMKTPVSVGQSVSPGYQFVVEAGVSFQQLNSDRSFEQVNLLARLARIPFEVVWRWGNDAKAAFPGKMGRASHN